MTDPNNPYGPNSGQGPEGQPSANPYGQPSAGDPYGQTSANDPYAQQQPTEAWGQQSAGDAHTQQQPTEAWGQQPTGDPYGQQGQYAQQGQAGQYGQPQADPYAQSYGGPGAGGYGGGGDLSSQGKGFFGALFDFSFSNFVTPKIIKLVYMIATVLIGLGLLIFLISALASGEAMVILLAIIAGPIVALIYLAIMRMTLEMYFAVVRLSEDVHHRLPKQ
ncbi:hypothetical protein GCM10028820_01150 [Tessaracoccus terricola]